MFREPAIRTNKVCNFVPDSVIGVADWYIAMFGNLVWNLLNDQADGRLSRGFRYPYPGHRSESKGVACQVGVIKCYRLKSEILAYRTGIPSGLTE